MPSNAHPSMVHTCIYSSYIRCLVLWIQHCFPYYACLRTNLRRPTDLYKSIISTERVRSPFGKVWWTPFQRLDAHALL